jgi:hypothetical protein
MGGGGPDLRQKAAACVVDEGARVYDLLLGHTKSGE